MYRLVICNERVSNPPSVIVRQLGNQSLTFFFPDSNKVYLSSSNVSHAKGILYCLDSNKDLYLYDPDVVKAEPESTRFRTIMTCSPDQRQYHETEKNTISYPSHVKH